MVFFVIIVALTLLLLWVRQRTLWTAEGMSASLRAAFAHSPAFGLKLLARKLGFALAVFVIVSPAILVFLWMLSLSLKNEIDNTAYPPVFLPSEFAWHNYVAVFEQNPFLLYTWNSIIVSGTSTLVALLRRRAGRLRPRQGAGLGRRGARPDLAHDARA